MADRKPNGDDAKKLLAQLDEDELDEVMRNPVVQEYLKRNGKNGKC